MARRPTGTKNKGSCRSRSLCRKQGINSALAELRSATSGLQAVLKNSMCRFSLIFRGFSAFCLKVAPLFNQENGATSHPKLLVQSSVYNAYEFFRLIILHLCINGHSCLTIFMSGQILHRFRVNTFMNQIRDISVPEKMWCHIEIQCIVDALVRSASLTKLR